ncbi:MAG: cold shock domain-containing protein [Magnetococcales bacterium]|nr:cold shock domain-containing protein [Magnetococcales bacterium]
MQIINKSLLFVKIHDSAQWPDPRTDNQKIPVLLDFYQDLYTIVNRQHGRVHKWIRTGVMGVFDQAMPALLAAVAIQEEIEGQHTSGRWRFYCKIGIATGPVHVCTMPDGSQDFLGAVVEQAARLAEQAHGNAIILDGNTHRELRATCDRQPHTWSGSRAGREQGRPFDAYFQRTPPPASFPYPYPDFFAFFWQAHDFEYLTTLPIAPRLPHTLHPGETGSGFKQAVSTLAGHAVISSPPSLATSATTCPPSSGVRHFGRVTAFKKERGFGFIQFYTEHDQYAEIYVHMTYVISQNSLKEHDHVCFTIQPGKGGRPQACSVLIMGSRMQGEVDALESDGSGRVIVRDHDDSPVSFHILPGQLPNMTTIQVGSLVEFTMGSGSETEGLIATEVTLPDSQTLVDLAAIGDELGIGDTEQAIVTTYFVDKGYGFAKCRRNNIYLHVSELTNPDDVLQQGDVISFYVSPGRDGTYRAQEIHKINRHDPPSSG